MQKFQHKLNKSLFLFQFYYSLRNALGWRLQIGKQKHLIFYILLGDENKQKNQPREKKETKMNNNNNKKVENAINK